MIGCASGPKECPEPAEMRWFTADDGGFITVSYDPANEQFDYEPFVLEAIQLWNDAIGCEVLVYTEDVGDIEIQNLPIDGQGGTLGVTNVGFSPDMSAGNTGVGNITLDTAEDWSVSGNLALIILHEMGHAIGLPHSPLDRGDSVMRTFFDPNYPDVSQPLTWDIEQVQTRYPCCRR